MRLRLRLNAYTAVLGVLTVLSAAVVLLTVKLYGGGQGDVSRAATDGRLALVNLSTGEVKGAAKLAHPPEQATAAEPPPKATAENEPPAPEAAAVTIEETVTGPSAPPPGVALKEQAPFLTEETDLGPLPKMSREGIKPWEYYRRNSALPTGKDPTMAVVLVGLGLNRKVADAALRLPETVSLAFSPYMKDAAVWASAARAWGHEIFVELPMETEHFPAEDPGPQALLSMNAAAENLQRLRWTLTRFPAYAGVYLPAGERFTASREQALPVLQFLSTRGLMMVNGSRSTREELEQMLDTVVLPTLKPDIVAPSGVDPAELQTLLLQLEGLARRQGQSIAVITASPAAVSVVAEWVQTLEKKGFIIVPVSALARARFS